MGGQHFFFRADRRGSTTLLFWPRASEGKGRGFLGDKAAPHNLFGQSADSPLVLRRLRLPASRNADSLFQQFGVPSDQKRIRGEKSGHFELEF